MPGTLSYPSVPLLFASDGNTWLNIKKTQREHDFIKMVRHSVMLRECFLVEHKNLSKIICRLIPLFAFLLKRMMGFSSLVVLP